MIAALTWPFAIACGLIALFGGGFVLGYFRDQARRDEAHRQTDLERLRAEAKTREAEIYARPAGSKSDIIGRL